jgi:hypothetical protein
VKHFKITDKTGQIISENLTQNCKVCLDNCSWDGKQLDCPEYGNKRRQGIRQTNSSVCFLCCDETKTTRLFKSKIEALSYSFPELIIPINEIRSEEQKKVNRLVHNLESINGHNIQEIYDLVPQDVLAKNWRTQIDFIKEEISKDPDKAALMFLRMAKHNTHMKSEFSIYRKIERNDSIDLVLKEHNLKNVLLNTLHTFFGDFNKRDVYVHVEEFFHKVKFDYSTMQVAFYHLIENSSKYTLPKSKVTIDAFEDDNWINLRFSMISTHVKPEERETVLKEGNSGINAKKMGAAGDGIGLWRINQMIVLNGGVFEPHFGDILESKMGFDFSENIFIIKLKKN